MHREINRGQFLLVHSLQTVVGELETRKNIVVFKNKNPLKMVSIHAKLFQL
jgi:hypothetical protein